MHRINRLVNHIKDIEDVGDTTVPQSSSSGATKKTRARSQLATASCDSSSTDGDSSCANCGPTSSFSNAPTLLHRHRPTTMTMNATASQEPPRTPTISTPEDYVASLRARKGKLRVFLNGELVDDIVANPIIRPSIRAVEETYRLALDQPELASAVSPISNYRVSRFLHITTSVNDVVMQNRMQRMLGALTGTCFQRCVGMDALNALYSVTYEIDAASGGGRRTRYHENLLAFIREFVSLFYWGEVARARG